MQAMPTLAVQDDSYDYITCKKCKKKKTSNNYYNFLGQGKALKCKHCTRCENKARYATNPAANGLAQKLRRLNSRMGTKEARFLLRAFGGRSALSGATWNLTIRPWNPLFEMSLSNIILLTRKEAAHHDDIGGMCGYPYLFRIHIVELLRETLLDKPLDTGCMEPVAVVDETNQVIEYCYVPTTNTSEWDRRLPPKLSHCDNWCRVDEWTRALQLWWGLKFNATAPVVVMKAIVGALERKSSFL